MPNSMHTVPFVVCGGEKRIRMNGVWCIRDRGRNQWPFCIYSLLNFRGFSTISLVEDTRGRKRYALKKITCHSTEDQIQAKKEIDFHKRFDHPNVLPIIGAEIKGHADIVHNITSDAYLILPYFSVSSRRFLRFYFTKWTNEYTPRHPLVQFEAYMLLLILLELKLI